MPEPSGQSHQRITSGWDASDLAALEQAQAQARAQTGAPASIITLAALVHHAQIDLIARLVDGTLVDLGRAKAHLHLHHIQPWSKGGSTASATSATPATHASAAAFTFLSATGRPLTAVAGNHNDHTQPLTTDHAYASAGHAGQNITTITNRAERLHLDYAVGVLLQNRR